MTLQTHTHTQLRGEREQVRSLLEERTVLEQRLSVLQANMEELKGINDKLAAKLQERNDANDKYLRLETEYSVRQCVCVCACVCFCILFIVLSMCHMHVHVHWLCGGAAPLL